MPPVARLSRNCTMCVLNAAQRIAYAESCCQDWGAEDAGVEKSGAMTDGEPSV